jgi:16S rRNA (uracil1498-N3)-methyltransferase
MECLFLPNLNENTKNIVIDNDEFKHIKALHIRQNEELLATNGNGIIAKLLIEQIDKRNAIAQLIEMTSQVSESRLIKGLALGILDNKDRFEFAVEKAVELGITDFYPLLCNYSQRKMVNIDRIVSKSIAAIKQSKQYFLPIIHQPLSIENLINSSQYNLLFADMETETSLSVDQQNNIIIVGPEGGFSEIEYNLLINATNCQGFSLGKYRLRAETAAVTAIGVYNFLINK